MTDTPHPNLKVTDDGGVVVVEIDRADKRNAISAELVVALSAAVRTYAYRSATRVIVIRGAGEHFCAGYDVATEDRDDASAARDRHLGALAIRDAIAAIAAAPVVKIAQLRGHVVGAGILLALACELRYADRSARFFIPELNMGIPFSLGGMTQLARYVGLTRAADMVLNCTPVMADHPDARPMVTELVAPEALERRVAEVAASLAARPPMLLTATLDTLREAGERLIPAAASDIHTMVAAQDDAESRAVRRAYSERFKRRSA
jgi:enoyl-CoA hydratase/carnithine racemase